MLKKRIIPVVLLDGFSVLKTRKFGTRRNLGSPITVMTTYNKRNVDELIILDIDASKQNRTIDHFIIKDITDGCFMPLTIGGGIKSCNDIELLLSSGADKITINSIALSSSSFILEAVRNFGSQCIVASIDVKNIDGNLSIHSETSDTSNIDIMEYLKLLENSGVGEIFINDVDRDGEMNGPNYELAKVVSDTVKVPIIFSGGIGQPLHCSELIKKGNVDAVGVSSIFHFTDYTPEDCRRALRDSGIPARMNENEV
jgi:imidazole glycerol-phosphate synthase subunit HisF